MADRSEVDAIVGAAEATHANRRDVRAFADRFGGVDLRPAIEAAADALDEHGTTVLLFAHAANGGRIDATLLEQVAPCVDTLETALAAFGSAIDDPVPAVLRLCDRAVLAHERQAALLFAAASRLEGRPSPGLFRHLRLLARERIGPEATVTLGLAGAEVRDEDVREVLAHEIEFAHTAAAAAFRARFRKVILGGVTVDLLPADRVVVPPPGGSVPRARDGVGRNDPCPCGSGRKFKRCCAETGGVGASTSAPAPRPPFDPMPCLMLPPAEFETLRAAVLVRLPPARMDWTQLCIARHVLAEYRRLEAADRIMEEAMRRKPAPGEPDDRDELLCEHIDLFFELGESDRARAWIARAIDPAEVESLYPLDLLLTRPEASVLGELDVLVQDALDPEEDGAVLVDLAHHVLDRWPALGIVLARGALQPERSLDSLFLVRAIEQARDRLLLPPDDLANDVLAALFGEGLEAQAARLEEDTESDRFEALRRASRRSERRVLQLENELRERERELSRLRARHEEATAAGASVADREADPEWEEERDRLRAKVRELKALIREGNESRAELRRELESAPSAADEAPAPSPDDCEGDAELAPSPTVDHHLHRLRRLRFGEAAEKAIARAPRDVGRRAMEKAGALAGGAAAAWRDAKPLRGIDDRWSARVGIHHRLLFRRPEGDVLEVVDLVTRQSLDASIRAAKK